MRIKIYSTVTTNSAQIWFLTRTAVECQLCRGTRCIYYQLPPWKTAGTRQYHDSTINTQLPNLLHVSENKTYSKGLKLLFMLLFPAAGSQGSHKWKMIFFYVSPRMQQSVRRHSAAVLTGNGSDMQGIHPAMYRLWEYNQKWLFVTTGIFTEH
jgi:hypothetical protein